MKHVLPEGTEEKDFPRWLAGVLAKIENGDEIELPTNHLCQVAAETIAEDFPDKKDILLTSQEPQQAIQGPVIFIGQPPPWLQGPGQNMEVEQISGAPLSYESWLSQFEKENGREPNEEEIGAWRVRDEAYQRDVAWITGWFDSLFAGFIDPTRTDGPSNDLLDRIRILTREGGYALGYLMEVARQSTIQMGGQGPEALQELRDLLRQGVRQGIQATSNCQCANCVARREREARADEEAFNEDDD